MQGPRRVLVEPVEPRRLLATVAVTNLADAGAGSLRDAVASAFAGDTISLAGLNGTIDLHSVIEIDKNLVIQGPGKDLLTISAGGNSQIFTQSVGALALSDVTLADGKSIGGTGGGGAIYQGDRPLAMTRVVVTGCDGGPAGGGAIASSGFGATLDLTDSTFTNNTAGGSGGAILDWGTSATFLRCTFSNNSAVGAAQPSLAAPGQTLPGNARGGAVAVYQGDATFTNCTISDNAANGADGTLGRASAWGGGVYFVNNGASSFTGCTIASNTATASAAAGGGVYFDNGTHTLADCIVAANFASGVTDPDLHLGGRVTSGGHNLISAMAAHGVFVNGTGGDIVGTLSAPIYPRLADLADNGGETPTRALEPGSLAIDAGSADGAPAADQRGQARVGAAPDIGAYEFVPVANHPAGFTSQPPADEAHAGALYSYHVTVIDADPADRVAVGATDLPQWLSLSDHGDGTATLSGTPDFLDFGAHTIVLTADDGHNDVTTQTFQLDVDVPPTKLLGDGTLRVNGTDDADDIHVWTRDHGNQLRVTINGAIKNFERAKVQSVYVLAFGGDDAVAINISTLPSTVVGGDGNDAVTGGAGRDSIVGGAGKDRVAGNGGDDRIYGGGGNDSLEGGSGDDTLFGQAGDDFLTDRDGSADLLRGGAADHDTADVDPGGVDNTTGIETLLT